MGLITIKHRLAPPFGRIVFGTFSKHLKQIKDLKLYRSESDQIIATSHDLGPQEQDYVYIYAYVYT